MPNATFRIGQIVPSSNTTMETELPAMFRRREALGPERFTFHSSRMRMRHVSKDELAAMDAESLRCAVELADARVDVLGYACVVAIMAMGRGYHRASQRRLGEEAAAAGCAAEIVTSAGALIDGLHAIGARKVSIVTPYLRPLTDLVVDYIQSEGIHVVDSIALEIPDNLEVGRRDPLAPLEELPRLDIAGADAVVISACVQMPSLESIAPAEDRLGLPVVSAASCTVRRMLISLGLDPVVPDAGAALSAKFAHQLAQAAN
jgi:maleate isomerase